MGLTLGLVGRGYWGNTYSKVLQGLGIPHWQAGRDWKDQPRPDGLIVASASDSHYEVARDALSMDLPVLIEKPVCMKSEQAEVLLSMPGIVFAGHTRLYDPAWEPFVRKVGKPMAVEAFAGGVNETNPDAELNWWVHLAAMCLDLGFDPERAVFHVTQEKQPLRFIANGIEFRDTGGAIANLVNAFCAAIERGIPDKRGLVLGLKTLRYVERHKHSERA